MDNALRRREMETEMAKIEFTTARGAKIELSHAGKALQVSINGAVPSFANIETRAALGLCVITHRIDHARKTTQECVIPVTAEAIEAVTALIPAPATMSKTDRLVERVNAEMNRANSAY